SRRTGFGRGDGRGTISVGVFLGFTFCFHDRAQLVWGTVRLADDVVNSSGVPALSQTASNALSSAGAAWTLGIAHRAGRSRSGVGLHLVGSGISHYPTGRGTLAGVRHRVLFCLEKNPNRQSIPERSAMDELLKWRGEFP